jgi:hypothetical protein
MPAGLQHVPPAMGANDRFDESAVDPAGAGDPGRGIGRRHDLFAAALAVRRDGDVHRDRPSIAAERRTAGLADNKVLRRGHAASCCGTVAPRRSLQSEVRPSTRRRRSMPVGLTSSRSTSNSMMRACSGGNSSAQSGSNSTRALRTSFSPMDVPAFCASRQVSY